MADNISIKDASGNTITLAAKDNSSVYSPRSVLQVGTADVSSGNPVPVSLPSTPTTNLANIDAWSESAVTQLINILAKFDTQDALAVKSFTPQPGTTRQLTTTASSQNQALTAGIKAIYLYARTNDARIKIGTGTQTASASTTYLPKNTVLILGVPLSNPNIAYIHGPDGAASTIEITELS